MESAKQFMNYKDTILIIMALIILNQMNCDSSENPVAANKTILYHNSFESEGDISGFNGLGIIEIKNQAAPNSGENCLFVSGGCLIPHAIDTIFTSMKECSLRISCWGKTESNGGFIALYDSKDREREIGINITDSSWKTYISEFGLHCEANSSLVLELNSGGFVPGSMLVDNLEITKIDK